MEEKKLNNTGSKKLVYAVKLLFSIIVAVILIFVSTGIAGLHDFNFNSNQKEEVKADFSGVTKICELSTLKCYYHNVAELKKDPDGIFKYGWLKYGFKKLWIEYTGTIEVGIDVDQVQVNDPDENNVVYVYVPDAKIMSVNADSDSISEPVSDTGIFTKITTEDQNNALTQAQQTMEEEASSDTHILNKAKENAKKLIEQYIINVGEEIGESYTVKWLSEPKTTTEDAEQ